MANSGTIAIALWGGDLLLWHGSDVELQLVEHSSQGLLVRKRHTTRSNNVRFDGVPSDRGQLYAVIATAGGHRDAAVFPCKPGDGSEVANLLLCPKKPKLNLAAFSYEALRASSPSLHDAFVRSGLTEEIFRTQLTPERQAGALNVAAKLSALTLGGAPASERVRQIGNVDAEGRIAVTGEEVVEALKGVQQDRLLCWILPGTADLLGQERQAGRFVVQDSNEVFHPGFPVSFKQNVSFCSMQFSMADHESDNGLVAADIDIDLFTKLNHVFGEVIPNTLQKFFTDGKKGRTDPFTVYRLLFQQNITPLYRLSLG